MSAVPNPPNPPDRPNGRGPRSGRRREATLAAALAVLPLLPFLGAAVSLDAPVFLAVSRQVLVDPTDPFGFDMIWDPTSPHAAEFNQNPPLLSYWLAPWIAVFGEWEPILHAALLPFAAIASLAMLGIARRIGPDDVPPLAATALLVTTPAFLVLASTLMLDVPVLACMLVAVYALLRAGEAPSPSWQLATGLAVAAAGLMKYVGLASLPLLAAGVLLLPPAGSTRLAAALRVLGIPLLVWTLWGVFTAHRYGAPHFAGGLTLVGERGLDPDELWNQLASVPIYYGGALLFPILAGFAAMRRDGARRGARGSRAAPWRGSGLVDPALRRAAAQAPAHAGSGVVRGDRQCWRCRGVGTRAAPGACARHPDRPFPSAVADRLRRLLGARQLARERGGRAARSASCDPAVAA